MIDLEKLRARASGQPDSDGCIGPTWCTPTEVIELLDHIAALEKDAGRLDWLDKQVKDHVVYNGYTWQEAGYEDNRGLVCAIQGKKQKLSVRQAIDSAMESKHG